MFVTVNYRQRATAAGQLLMNLLGGHCSASASTWESWRGLGHGLAGELIGRAIMTRMNGVTRRGGAGPRSTPRRQAAPPVASPPVWAGPGWADSVIVNHGEQLVRWGGGPKIKRTARSGSTPLPVTIRPAHAQAHAHSDPPTRLCFFRAGEGRPGSRPGRSVARRLSGFGAG